MQSLKVHYTIPNKPCKVKKLMVNQPHVIPKMHNLKSCISRNPFLCILKINIFKTMMEIMTTIFQALIIS